METVSESLSEGMTPAAPPRSPEDQDLLERSTKKNKRGRTYLEAATSQSREVLMKETPEAVTPESANWRTPDDTPNQARGHEEVPPPPEEDYASDDDPPESSAAKVPKATEKYGTWMLVTRNPRRNNARGNKLPGGHPTTRQNGYPGENRTRMGGQGLQSRFAPLDGMEEDGREQQQEDHLTPSGFQPPNATLPRIRTNFRSGHRLQGQGRPEPPFEPHMDRPTFTPQDRVGFSGRGGRGRGPNQAAADSEHTVVRGSNKGKDITKTSSACGASPPTFVVTAHLLQVVDRQEVKAEKEAQSSASAWIPSSPLFDKPAICTYLAVTTRNSLVQTTDTIISGKQIPRILSFSLITLREYPLEIFSGIPTL
nr:uncharacterized protein LOC109150807 [Ipomoea batatas]